MGMKKDKLFKLEDLRAEVYRGSNHEVIKALVDMQYQMGYSNRASTVDGVIMDLFFTDEHIDIGASTLLGNPIAKFGGYVSLPGHMSSIGGVIPTGKVDVYDQYTGFSYDGWISHRPSWYNPYDKQIWGIHYRDSNGNSGAHTLFSFSTNGVSKQVKITKISDNFTSDGTAFWDPSRRYYYQVNQTRYRYVNCHTPSPSWINPGGTVNNTTWGGKLMPYSPGNTWLIYLEGQGVNSPVRKYSWVSTSAADNAVDATFDVGCYFYGQMRVDHYDSTRGVWWIPTGSAYYNNKPNNTFFAVNSGGKHVDYPPHPDFNPAHINSYPYTYYNGNVYVFPNIAEASKDQYVYVMNAGSGSWTKRKAPSWVRLYVCYAGDISVLSATGNSSKVVLRAAVQGVRTKGNWTPTIAVFYLYDLVNDEWDLIGFQEHGRISSNPGQRNVSDGSYVYSHYGVGTTQKNDKHSRVHTTSAETIVVTKDRRPVRNINSGKLYVVTSPLASSDTLKVEYSLDNGTKWKALARDSVTTLEDERDEHAYIISEASEFSAIKFKLTLTPGAVTQFPYLNYYAFIY